MTTSEAMETLVHQARLDAHFRSSY
ncbi:MAG: hypothetical protein QOI63_1341, partial [Thermoplasmata archaeon]|nr:hypothetical protein [Thermoplasmata archaeon]